MRDTCSSNGGRHPVNNEWDTRQHRMVSGNINRFSVSREALRLFYRGLCPDAIRSFIRYSSNDAHHLPSRLRSFLTTLRRVVPLCLPTQAVSPFRAQDSVTDTADTADTAVLHRDRCCRCAGRRSVSRSVQGRRYPGWYTGSSLLRRGYYRILFPG